VAVAVVWFSFHYCVGLKMGWRATHDGIRDIVEQRGTIPSVGNMQLEMMASGGILFY